MKQSLRTAVTAIMILLITLSGAFAGFYAYEVYASTADQIASSSIPALRAVETTAFANLDTAEHYLYSVAYDSAIMENLGSTDDPTGVYAAGDALRNAYSSLIYADSTIAGILVYDTRTGVSHNVYGHLSGDTGAVRVEKKEQITAAAMAMIADMTLDLSGWNVVAVGDAHMLYRAVYWVGVYSICMVDLNALVSHYTALYDLPGTLAVSRDGQWLTAPDEAALETGRLTTVADYASVNRRTQTLVVSCGGDKMNFVCFIPMRELLHQVNTLQLLVLIMAMLCVIGLVLMLIYLRRQFVRPMNSLMETMERIQAGDLEARPSARYNTSEFRALNETFNSMVISLRDARIQVYEKDLENQRVQLSALRLQIRPHFYLNCLKNIYAAATLGDTETVCAQILHMGTHLRYCFSDLGQTVPLRQELEMCRNYTEMLLLNRRSLCFETDVEDALMDFRIPPMIILTAVENAARYFRTADRPSGDRLEISVAARMLHMENTRMVNIVIRDNGPGFSEEALRLIANPSAGHVGISNIVRQLRFIFGPECEVAFTNHGGAQVDYFIPVKEDVKPDESTDC